MVRSVDYAPPTVKGLNSAFGDSSKHKLNKDNSILCPWMTGEDFKYCTTKKWKKDWFIGGQWPDPIKPYSIGLRMTLLETTVPCNPGLH